MVRQPKPGDSLPFHSPWIFEEEQRAGRAVQDDGLPENAELLRRLDGWTENENPGPLIRWAAAHLRGELGAAPPLHDPEPDAT